MRPSVLPALAVFALLAALPAQAQPRRNAAPQSGTLVAAAEPASVEIRAGGPDLNAVPGNGCSGYIRNDAPNASVTFEGGGPLAIYATSGTDTTMLVLDPSGRWHCSDDADGSNPAVTFSSGAAGTYKVWVGTFSPDAAGAEAQLSVVRGRPSW